MQTTGEDLSAAQAPPFEGRSVEQKTDEQVAGHSFLSLLGNGIRLSLSFGATILASRWLGAEDFGYFSLLIAYINSMNFILPLGFDHSVTYFVSRFNANGEIDNIHKILKSSLTLCIGTGLLIMVAGTWIANIALTKANLSELIVPALLLLYQTLIWAIGSILAGFLRGMKVFAPTILREQIIFPIAHVVFLTIFVKAFGQGLNGYVFGYSLATLLAFVFVAYCGFKVYRALPARSLSSKLTRQTWLKWLNFSYPLGLMSGLEPALIGVSTILVGWYLLPEQVGAFTICLRLMLTVQFFYVAIGPIFGSYFAEAANVGTRTEIRNLYQMVNYWSAKWAVLMACLLALAADYVLKVFGNDVATTANMWCLILILPGAAFEACFGSTKQSLVMAGRNKINIFDYITAGLIIAISSMRLTPTFGVTGAAASFSIGLISLNLLRVFQVHQTLRVWPLNRRQIRNLFLMSVAATTITLMAHFTELSGVKRVVFAVFVFTSGLILTFWNDRALFLAKLKAKTRKR